MWKRKRIDGARRPPPNAAGGQARNGQTPSSPLIGVKRPEIWFLHENSKSVPAGSNPSKRHRAGPGIIAPSDDEPSKGRSTQASLAAVDRRLRASQRRERAWSGTGRGTTLVRR